MHAEPQREHQWLQQLVGDWTVESEAVMGPGQPPIKMTGSERVRSLGGLWVVGEGEGHGDMPEGHSAMRSIITLGFDPQRGRFRGTFIASVMTHLWLYDGALDASGRILTLDTEGPNFMPGADPTAMSKYQDVIEIVSPDHRTLTSAALGEDGQWHRFMTAHYRRTG